MGKLVVAKVNKGKENSQQARRKYREGEKNLLVNIGATGNMELWEYCYANSGKLEMRE